MKQLGILLTLLFFCLSNKAAQEQIEQNGGNLELDEKIISAIVNNYDAEIFNIQERKTNQNKKIKNKKRRKRKSDSWKLLSNNPNKTTAVCLFCNTELYANSLKYIRNAAWLHRKENPECFEKYNELKN